MQKKIDWSLYVWRSVGFVVGCLLWLLIAPRRRVVLSNLKLCFSSRSWFWHIKTSLWVFIRFAQSWVDRIWLWQTASQEKINQRVCFTGALEALQAQGGKILVGAHLMGLDACWTGLNSQFPSLVFFVLTASSRVDFLDRYVNKGRSRWGQPKVLDRRGHSREALMGLKQGGVLCMLPDMDFGRHQTVFLPFFGVPASWITSVSRMASATQASIIFVSAKMTKWGYEVCLEKPCQPQDQAIKDVVAYKNWLEQQIMQDPTQYYWVHKRFKTRPLATMPSPY